MRFLALDLRDYGPFRGTAPLDLSGGARGLHLIVGPNEAGKSTALRAIRAVLFDYPRSTPDDHGRDPATLRLGARLRSESGAEVAFVRRKRGQRFWTPDDRSALAGDPVADLLDGLDESTFVDLFSTDHAELVQGGQAILAGGGQLGAMLFAAGSGLAQLEAVREGLQGQIEALFKSRNAKIPAINKGLDALKTARDMVRAEALPTAEWVAAEAELTRATARRAEVARQRHAAQADLDRRRGWLAALRLIPRRTDVLSRLDALGSAPDLRPDFAPAVQAEGEAERLARRSILDADASLGGLTAQIAALGEPDLILVEADAVRRLHADLGHALEAHRDRPDLAARLGRLDERVATLRAELPPSAAIPPGGLASLRDPIQALAVADAQLQAQTAEAEAELARHAGPEPTEPVPTDAPDLGHAVRWAEALGLAIARAVSPGDLEAHRRATWARRAALADAAAASLRALALWSGTLAELAALAIPPEATFDQAEGRLRAADEAIQRAQAERTQLQTRRLDLDQAAERADLGGPVPTLADLASSREHRDRLWGDLRASRDAAEPWVPQQADQFEASLHAADRLADTLRREADRVAASAQRTIDRRDLDDRLRLNAETLSRAQADRQAVGTEWAAHWRPLGIEPLSPREMRDWVRVDRSERLRQLTAIRDLDEELSQGDAQLLALRRDLDGPLTHLGEPPVGPTESLALALDRARAVVDRVGARVRLGVAERRLAGLLAERAAWHDRWRTALEPLGLDSATSPAGATLVLDRLGAWHDASREAQATRDRLADLDAVERRFAAATAALGDRLGEGLASLPAVGADPAATVRGLVDRLDQANAAQAGRVTLREQVVSETARRAKAEQDLARATEALADLAAEAGCTRVADLPGAIQRARAVAEDRAELRRLDEQLDRCAGTLTRPELLAAVADADEASLAAAITDIEETLADQDAEVTRLGEAIGAARERLDTMSRRRGAFGAQEEVSHLTARLAGQVEEYARLRLASAVLRDAIERYRVGNQGEVLRRASALFARLTGDAFVGLQPDRDDKGENILRAVRRLPPAEAAPGGDAPPSALLDVAALSAGTADQLYLALRLACLSVHLDDHPPAPLVVDDILIQADNHRARAALLALAELSTRTQVLFFTHHDHLVDLARAAVPADALFVHRLDSRATAGPGSSVVPAPKSRRAPRPSSEAVSPG